MSASKYYKKCTVTSNIQKLYLYVRLRTEAKASASNRKRYSTPNPRLSHSRNVPIKAIKDSKTTKPGVDG